MDSRQQQQNYFASFSYTFFYDEWFAVFVIIELSSETRARVSNLR